MKSAAPKWKRWLRRLGIGGIAVVALLVVSCAMFFEGPYKPVTAAPKQPMVVDVHCHCAGIGGGGSGCFVSKHLQNSYKFGIYLKAFGVTREQLLAEGDGITIRKISEHLSRSTNVAAALVLAIDGIVDNQGRLDTNRTEFYVPNEFVQRETAKFTNLFWGASINPYRPDSIQRLEWAHRNGAKLVKWLPSIMLIDPADERISAFYKRMVELEMPLLSHTGQERSFTHARDELADPVRLELPLKLGVTVIAAHIASTGSNDNERDVDRLAKMMAKYPKLYSEISSLTQVNKLGYLKEALLRPEFQGRLLYGTDFPLINTALVSPYLFPLNLRPGQMADLAAIENPWDRDVAMKHALGVPDEIFHRTAEVLKLARPADAPAR